jgi:hypothetical protein
VATAPSHAPAPASVLAPPSILFSHRPSGVFSLTHILRNYLLLLYSCKSFKALSFNRSRDAHAQTSVEQSQQLIVLNLTICTPPSPISVCPAAGWCYRNKPPDTSSYR